jgi:phosphotransacetylase
MLDLAFAAEAKRIEGEVIGAADAMVFPNLLSANLTVKAIMYTAACRYGGVLTETTALVVFMPRDDNGPRRADRPTWRDGDLAAVHR